MTFVIVCLYVLCFICLLLFSYYLYMLLNLTDHHHKIIYTLWTILYAICTTVIIVLLFKFSWFNHYNSYSIQKTTLNIECGEKIFKCVSNNGVWGTPYLIITFLQIKNHDHKERGLQKVKDILWVLTSCDI